MSKPLRVLIVEDSEDDALLVIRTYLCGGLCLYLLLADHPVDF